jgi:hypothetical protein
VENILYNETPHERTIMKNFKNYGMFAGLAMVAIACVIVEHNQKKNEAEHAEKKAEVTSMLLAETLVKMKLYNGDYNEESCISPEEDWEFFRMLIRYAD